jgi:transcriptional regulator with XRE-family HTH domain
MAVRRKAASSSLALRLGKNLATCRKARHWTQAEFAERVGVDTETVSRFERGAALPSLSTLERLAHVARVSLAELLTESSARPDDQAQTLSAWLSDLGESDRLLVLDVTKRLCQHMRSGKSTGNARRR